jgi:NAD(P)-dependent dehydrogenase (short-subunit alcohol dehydrogenase family)
MAKQPRALSGKVAVVTGGGRGIGKALAHALQREGVRVAIGDVDAEAAAQAATEVGGGAVGLPLDVTDRPGFTAFLDDVEQRLGQIDVLVNNAGIMPLATLDREDDAITLRQLELNLHAVIHGTRESIRRMRQRGTGHIVNVASAAGKTGFAGGATYSACKHGVVGLSEAVRVELRGTGVEVSVVMPIPVRTELGSGLGRVRGFAPITPEQVADEIVDALKFPRFDVFVPKSVGRTLRVTNLLPRRVNEAVARFLGSDRVLLDTDPSVRAGYERRAAASAPAVDEQFEAEPPVKAA